MKQLELKNSHEFGFLLIEFKVISYVYISDYFNQREYIIILIIFGLTLNQHLQLLKIYPSEETSKEDLGLQI